VTVVVTATPAAAHSCAQPARVVKDRDTEIRVSATGGDVPVDEVTFQFSKSIELKAPGQQAGWTAQQVDGSSVRFTGGKLDPNACATFPVTIRATKAGSFAVRAFLLQENGAVVEHPAQGDIIQQPDGSTIVVDYSAPPNPAFEQVIIADDNDSGGSTIAIIAAAAALPVLALVGYWLFGRASTRRK
jgi:hypothetical protein